MALTVEVLDEVAAGLDRVLELLVDLRPSAHEPSTLTRLDAAQRRTAVLLHSVIDELT